jgi:hypothetical protein
LLLVAPAPLFDAPLACFSPPPLLEPLHPETKSITLRVANSTPRHEPVSISQVFVVNDFLEKSFGSMASVACRATSSSIGGGSAVAGNDAPHLRHKRVRIRFAPENKQREPGLLLLFIQTGNCGALELT